MYTKLEEIKLLKKDVLLRLKKRSEIEGSRFIIEENPQDDPNQFFTVLAKSDNVKLVNVGDVVLCPWTRITPPFPIDIDGETADVGVTSEDELIAVFEGVN